MKILQQALIASLASLSNVASAKADRDAKKAPSPISVAKATEKSTEAEALDRRIDQVAAASQKAAVARLEQLLTRYKNSDQEPTLLSRLAEARQQEGMILFRIAHGRAHRGGQKLDLTAFRASMKASIAVLDRLLSAFPNYPERAEALFLRAKGFDEIESKEPARRDYRELVAKYPDSARASESHMRLAEYAIDENKHVEAVKQLEAIEAKPADALFPFALYKLAWSHYNLGDFSKALSYIERHVVLARARSDKSQEASDTALLETSLMDLSLFKYESFEKRHESYNALAALRYFRSIESGEFLGRMISRYAYLLRAGAFTDELVEWKNLVLKEEFARPETLEVAMALFEDRVNKRDYAQLAGSGDDLLQLHKVSPGIRGSVAFDKARATLLSTAEDLQKLTIKNKGASEVRKLVQALSKLYLTFVEVAPSGDMRIPRSRYNLAEAYFQTGDFEAAAHEYRWIVQNWRDPKTFDVTDSALRAVAARYESLKRSGVIPKSLEARHAAKSGPKPDAALEEWLVWIDASIAKKSWPETTAGNYVFEANRALYANGQIDRASQRFLEFAEAAPTSEFAVPSASLVLDTEILENRWERVQELAHRLRRVSAWKALPFHERLTGLETDAAFKLAENALKAGRPEEAQDLARACARNAGELARGRDCELLAAKAAMASKKEGKAEELYGRLIDRAPASEAAGAALVSRARLFESRYDFAASARDDREALSRGQVSNGDQRALRERVLRNAWLAGAAPSLKDLVNDERICPRVQDKLCARYARLAQLEDPTVKLPDFGAAEESGLESLVAFYKQGKDAAPAALQAVASRWDSNDLRIQMSALSALPAHVHSVLERERLAIGTGSKLKAEKPSIRRRIERIQAFEDLTVKVVRLPLRRIRVDALNQSAESYVDIANELRAIPAPKDLPEKEHESYVRALEELALPFEEKANEIRRKGLELALSSQVEPESLAPLAKAFERDNPSSWKSFKDRVNALNTLKPLDLKDLARLDAAGEWDRYSVSNLNKLLAAPATERTPEELGRVLRWSWWKALSEKRLAAAAHFLVEMRDSKRVDAPAQEIMRGFTLEKAGARAEARALIGDRLLAPTAQDGKTLVTAAKTGGVQ